MGPADRTLFQRPDLRDDFIACFEEACHDGPPKLGSERTSAGRETYMKPCTDTYVGRFSWAGLA
jgi:hypothetical protein